VSWEWKRWELTIEAQLVERGPWKKKRAQHA